MTKMMNLRLRESAIVESAILESETYSPRSDTIGSTFDARRAGR